MNEKSNNCIVSVIMPSVISDRYIFDASTSVRSQNVEALGHLVSDAELQNEIKNHEKKTWEF